MRANGLVGESLGGDPFGGAHVGNAYRQDLVDLANALRHQSKLSGQAAILAGVSVLLRAGAQRAYREWEIAGAPEIRSC